jgi:hypothetical protein
MYRSTRRLLAAAAVVCAAAAGCGAGRQPVNGRVAYEDGSPVPAGTVVGEATVDGKPVTVQGRIGPDGRFTWGGEKPDDGALPGTYKVAVLPVPLGDYEKAQGKQPAVGGKYGRFESSGITFEVKPAGPNTLDITVAKPKPKAGED